MALAWRTYAEFCVVKADELAHIPEGLEMTTAAAIPLVSVTGDQLVHQAAKAQPGQTILITGALGSVGRCAVFAAMNWARRSSRAFASNSSTRRRTLPGVVDAVALDDDEALARLGLVDCVADTVGGAIAAKLLAKVKQGGVFGSVVGPPKDAALHPNGPGQRLHGAA